MTVVIAVAAGVFGSLIGSFLNVVVYRVPRRLSLVQPPSACPNCNHPIRPIDNVPVLSWLALRGACRDCKAPISRRYPTVELGTALSFVPVAIVFQPTATGLAGLIADIAVLVGFLGLAAVSIALALIDLDTHTLPNRIVLPSAIALAVLFIAAAILRQDGASLVGAAIGALALFAFYLLLALFTRGGMGMGDVKLALLLGLAAGWVGWPALVVGSFAAFVFGGLFGLALMVLGKAGKGSGIPFGPWMIAGAWVGIFFGEPIWLGYASLTGLV